MTVTLLRAADRMTRLWLNGGGTTCDIVTVPPGAGLSDFAWRLSMAEVATVGPFSHFDGVDRAMAILEGRLGLAIAGRAPVVLDPDGPVCLYPGDVAVEGGPISGVVTDLNLMLRRGRATGDMTRIGDGAVTAAAVSLFFAVALSSVQVGDRAYDLDPHDALLVEGMAATAIGFSGFGYHIAIASLQD